jgi:hypothetical protein
MEHLNVEGEDKPPNVSLKIVDANDETSEDDFDILTEDYNFRYAKQMTLSGYTNATNDYRRCTIDFNRKIFSEGCSINVWGDTAWVRAVFPTLWRQLSEGRPWWAFVRRPTVIFVIFALIAFSALVVLGDFMLNLRVGVDWLYPVVILGIIAVIVISVAVFMNWLWVSLFPGFEVRDPATVSPRLRLGRTIGVIVGAILAAISLLQGVVWLLERIGVVK